VDPQHRKDLQRTFAFANGVEADVFQLNGPTIGRTLQAPFGPSERSSANTFRKHGQAAIRV